MNILWLRVKCNKCAEEIGVRVDKAKDLQSGFSDSGPAFTLKKEILGNRCNNLMVAYLEFDRDGNIISQEVEGGQILD